MNWIDIVIVLVIGSFTITAYMAGLIREVVTLVSAFLGIIVAGLFYQDLGNDVLVFIEDDAANGAVSFLVLLGAVYLAGQLVAVMLKTTASLLLLGWADRIGGALFGFLKGLIIVEVLLIVLVTYPLFGLDDDIDGSGLASLFLDAVPALLLLLPNEFEQAVDAFVA
jgi:membrane protein required for colicin V production